MPNVDDQHTPSDRSEAASVAVSVILPAYNEEATIANTVHTTLETLQGFLPAGTFEVIIAEDGCSDQTPAIADKLAAENPSVRHLHSKDRLGRGKALEQAFKTANGDVLVYFDTDLATDLKHLEELIMSVRDGEYAIATGSRWMPGEEVPRPMKRSVASRVFNSLTRFFLPSTVYDHQCGFKAFHRDALDDILDDVKDPHWFWDTEVLVRAQREGYRIHEFSVDWTPKGDSKVDLFRDVFGMGGGILRTWWDLRIAPRITHRTTVTAGTVIMLIAAVAMLYYLDPAELLGVIRTADIILLGIATMVYIASWPLRGLRYHRILAELGYPEDVPFLTGAIFISQTGNLVFPARAGDVIRAYVIKKRRSIPYTTGIASIAAERLFDLLTITVVAGAMLLGLIATGFGPDAVTTAATAYHESGRIGVLAAGIVAILAIAGTLLVVLSASSNRSYIREMVHQVSSDVYAESVAARLAEFASDVQYVTADRERFAKIGGDSVLIWTVDAITAMVVLVALGSEIGHAAIIGVILFAVSVANLAKVLPLSPGGIGLYEGTFSVLMVTLTAIPLEVALVASILDHAIKNLVTITGGTIAMLALNISLSTAAEEAPDSDSVPGD